MHGKTDLVTNLSSFKVQDFSYPVGKVDELTLYPMDFEEFLWATNNDVLAEEIREHYKTNEGLAESVQINANGQVAKCRFGKPMLIFATCLDVCVKK